MDSRNHTRQLQKQNRALSILNAIAQALNRSIDLDQALRTALANVAELLDLQTGWIWLFREQSGEPYLAASQNLPSALANNPQRMEGSCYCLDTYQIGELEDAANVNVVTCSRLKNLVGGTDGLRYHASIPLSVHGKRLGMLNVASTDWRELSSDDLQLLYTIGDMLSIAIERARLFEFSTEFGVIQERNRLAREIHDTLAQGLAAISLQLETAEALIEINEDTDQVRDAIHQALLLARSNLDEARRSVLDLRAGSLEGRTLPEALQNLAADHSRAGNFLVDYEFSGSRPLPARIETGIYRMVQEALTNVARHANAQNVRLKLAILSDQIRLVIEDDGQGFDIADVSQDRFGLLGLNERAKVLGGKFQLKSNLGSGTRMEASFPLQNPTGSIHGV
jgi:two-component system NarL family sensor kinase